jgi:hypothetical protein
MRERNVEWIQTEQQQMIDDRQAQAAQKYHETDNARP